jgi:Ca2+-binding RTX toxin-like protein
MPPIVSNITVDSAATENRTTIFNTIQAAVNAAASGDTITVAAGTYTENVTISTSGITLVSAAGRDTTFIEGISGVGALGAIVLASGVNDVTIGDTDAGFTITGVDNGNPGIENAAVYIQGAHDGITLRGNDIVANGDLGLLSEYSAVVSNVTVDDNIFSGQTFTTGTDPVTGDQFTVPNVARQVVVLGGNGQNTSNVIFTNNQITGTAGGLDAGGAPAGNTLVTIDAADSTITGNEFTGFTARFASQLRVREDNNDVTGNTFSNDAGGNVGTFFGLTGSETLGAVGNTYTYGDGDNTIFAVAGNDMIDGGAGTDTINMAGAGAGGGFVDLNSGVAFSAATGLDMLSNIENATGSAGNDGLLGNDGDNVFTASTGTDAINGRGGSDTFNAAAATSTVNANLTTGTLDGAFNGTLTNIENIITGAGADSVAGSAANNTISTGAGADVIVASAGTDVIDGGDDFDTVVFAGARGDYTVTWDGTTAIVTSTVEGGEGNVTTVTNAGLLSFTTGGDVRLVSTDGDYTTIAAAVTDSSDGDEILVGAGSFAGVTLAKDVILRGVQSGNQGYDALSLEGVARSAELETTITSQINVNDASTNTIDGFRFENINALNVQAFEANVTFSNNVVIGGSNQFVGGSTGVGTIVITGNYINSTTSNGFQINSMGNGDVTVSGNLFNGTGAGGAAVNANGIAEFDFSNNVVMNTSSHGVQVAGDMGNVTIDDNTFDGTVQRGDLDRGAISVAEPQNFTGDLTITNNTVTDSPYGIAYRAGLEADSTAITTTISGNNFSGAAESEIAYLGNAVDNVLTGGSDDALFRGFGGNDSFIVGSGDDTVEGGDGFDSVVFAGDRGSYTVTWDGTTAIVDDNAGNVTTISSAGLLEFTTGGNVHLVSTTGDYTTIQAAVTASANDDAIMVSAGTYTGDLTIDKDITLIGANAGTSATDPRDAATVLTGVITLASDGITIDGIDMDGAGTTNHAIRGGEGVVSYDDITITNVNMYGQTAQAILNGFGSGGAIGAERWTITDNKISDISGNAATGMLLFNIDNLTLTGNTVENDDLLLTGRRGINLDGIQTGLVQGNTVSLGLVAPTDEGAANTAAPWAIQISMSDREAMGLTIDNNTISGARYGINGLSQRSISDLAVTDNMISNVINGIAMNSGGTAPVVTGVTMDVTITGNTVDAAINAINLRDLHDNELTPNGGAVFDAPVVTGNIITSGIVRLGGTEFAGTSFEGNVLDLVNGGTFDGSADNDTALMSGTGPITFDGGAGDDTITGGAGADTLVGGAGADMIRGGTGDDLLVADTADTVLDGNGGFDTVAFAAGTALNDVIARESVIENVELIRIGTAGTATYVVFNGMQISDASAAAAVGDTIFFASDTIDLSYAANAVTVDLAGRTASGVDVGSVQLATNVVNAIGGDGNDMISGSAVSNTLAGGAGNDTLFGSAGNDTLSGGSGTDTANYSAFTGNLVANLTAGFAFGAGIGSDSLSSIENFVGGSGNDAIFAAVGGSMLSGGAGNDTLFGTAAVDNLIGGDGDDVLEGGGGSDTLDGGRGNDYIYGTASVETLIGGFNLDTLDYSASTGALTVRLWNNTASGGDAQGDVISGFENVTGGFGGDFLAGNDTAANLVLGGAGNDSLMGLAGADTLDGGDGDDVITGDQGSDVLIGGLGIDMLDYSPSASAVEVRLWNNTASGGIAQGDVISGFENITGGFGSDFLVGDSGANLILGSNGDDSIRGLDGADTLDGGNGNDVIFGEEGADVMIGGAGVDTLNYSFSGVAVQANLLSNTVSGGFAQGDTVSGFENVVGGNGNDTLSGDNGANVMRGSNGNDIVNGLGGDDTLRGDAGNDTLSGDAGNDVLLGDAGNDIVNGGAGNDTLSGNAGNDTLDGGSGNDVLSGNGGADVFVFSNSAFGQDTIADFGGIDELLFTGGFSEVSDFDGFIAASSQVGANVVYDFDNDGQNTITLNNLMLDDLNASDMSFTLFLV